jgi:hypothetical protein
MAISRGIKKLYYKEKSGERQKDGWRKKAVK